MKVKWKFDELVDMFSSDKTFLNCLSSFINLEQVNVILSPLLSMLFFVLINILKFFSHNLCIKLWRIQKHKFCWCKTTTAWVMGIGLKNSCTWPQCAGGGGGLVSSECLQLGLLSGGIRLDQCWLAILCLRVHVGQGGWYNVLSSLQNNKNLAFLFFGVPCSHVPV